jgi:hypothetical protein
MNVVPHPPHSPDLALGDFFVFPNLKLAKKGAFNDVTIIQAKSRDALALQTNDFRKCS